MNKIKVGDTFWVVAEGINSGRYNQSKGLPPDQYEGIVTKVGRKYFTVKFSYLEAEFEIDSLKHKTEYCSDYHLYASKESYDTLVESRKQLKVVRGYFDTFGGHRKGNMSPEQLKTIYDIIVEVNNEE